MNEMEDFVVYVKEPVGECQFCEYGELHRTGYGFVCTNLKGKYYGKHLGTEFRGQNTDCEKWMSWEEKNENERRSQ